MTDCPNADVRDRLPGLAAGTLTPAERADVERHLAGCAECRAELALLEAVRRTFARPVAIDTGRIAAAIPRADDRASSVGHAHAGALDAKRTVAGPRFHAARWRVAAGVAVVALGAGMIWTLRESSQTGLPPTDSVARADVAAPERAVALGYRLGDLSVEDLEDLLGALESIDALPAVEPAPIIGPLGGGEGT